MRTKAHAIIQRRYVEQGNTTRFVVLPLPGGGLPADLVDGAQPVTLDLLAGRPVNLELDDEGLSADLCFGGPPTRCSFPWESVVAVQDSSGQLVPTLVVTVAMVMEDDTVEAATGAAGPDSPMTVLEGGGAGPEATPDHRPVFEVIDGRAAADDKK